VQGARPCFALESALAVWIPAVANRPSAPSRRKPIPCKDCGLLFAPKWPLSRRCDACHKARLESEKAAASIARANRCRQASDRTKPQLAQIVCVGCGEKLNRFPTAKRCEACARVRRREVKRQSRGRNPETARLYAIHRRAGNRDRDRSNRLNWTKKHRERLTAYKRDYDNHRKRVDPVFKLVSYVRSRVATALRDSRLKGQRVTARGALRYLGCSFDEFARHIESQFKDGMSWENFGRGGWHIDHIYPLGRVDFTDLIELWAALNWRNCRPMWEPENLLKKATVTEEAAELFAELKAQAARVIADDGTAR